MKPNDDITNFWLAWRELCSIRLCTNAEFVRTNCKDNLAVAERSEEVAQQARDVIETTNRYFAGMIRSPRNVKALKRFADKAAAERPQSLEGPWVDDDQDEGDFESDSLENQQPVASDSPISDFGKRMALATEDPDEQVPSRIESICALGDDIKRGKLVSEYIDLVAGWNRHDDMTTTAFELVEIDLYRESAEKMGLNGSDGNAEPMLKGRKLKDYLFEDIGGRPGGLCPNLWGYLLKKDPLVVNGRKFPSRLRMVANASFRNPVEDKPFNPDDDGISNEQVDLNSLEPDKEILVRQAGDILRAYLLGRWATYFDVADKIALCCAFFEYVLSDPFVKGLVPISGSALNVRKVKRVSEVFEFLKMNGFEFDTVRALFMRDGQQILRDIAIKDEETRDDACMKLVSHFEETRTSAGK